VIKSHFVIYWLMKILKSYEIFESFEIFNELFEILENFEILKFLTEYTSREVYSLWGTVGKMPIRKKRNSLLLDIWYFDPPTHGISTPYPWNIEPPTHDILSPPTHGISTPYPWYFDPPIHGISTPIPMPGWYIDPLTHGISTPLSMVFWPPYHGISTPYACYFDLPSYLLIRNGGGSKYHGGFNLPYRGWSQFSIRGFNRSWIEIYPGVNLPWGSKYHMTPAKHFGAK
jgi:hypothetical protein